MHKTKQMGKDRRKERQQMNIKLPCWGIYLCLLLGWRRSCCTTASAAAIAALASSRWVWVTLVLLWLRDGPWEQRWPSDEDFELPGLLWDFSVVGSCMSGYKRVKHELKLLQRSSCQAGSHIIWNRPRFMLILFLFLACLCNCSPYSNVIQHLGDNFWEERQEDDNLEKRGLRRGMNTF